jgi:hypothetical protein
MPSVTLGAIALSEEADLLSSTEPPASSKNYAAAVRNSFIEISDVVLTLDQSTLRDSLSRSGYRSATENRLPKRHQLQSPPILN